MEWADDRSLAEWRGSWVADEVEERVCAARQRGVLRAWTQKALRHGMVECGGRRGTTGEWKEPYRRDRGGCGCEWVCPWDGLMDAYEWSGWMEQSHRSTHGP